MRRLPAPVVFQVSDDKLPPLNGGRPGFSGVADGRLHEVQADARIAKLAFQLFAPGQHGRLALGLGRGVRDFLVGQQQSFITKWNQPLQGPSPIWS